MVFPVVIYGCELDCEEGWALKNWCFWTVVLEKTLESPRRRSNQSILREISPEYSLEGLMLKLKLQYFLATWYEELTHWKRPWCWERLKAGGERDDRRWDGWMASPTQWTWVWISFQSWWWTGKPGVLKSMGCQRVGHDWATELKWYMFHWRGERLPTPVFWRGEFHGLYSPWGCKESYMTEWLSLHFIHVSYVLPKTPEWLFFFLTVLCSEDIGDLSSSTRNWTCAHSDSVDH